MGPCYSRTAGAPTGVRPPDRGTGPGTGPDAGPGAGPGAGRAVGPGAGRTVGSRSAPRGPGICVRAPRHLA
ncbi:hypothetical protein D1J60_29320 [Streptomyces sp. W1SF4]|nr:hypothetical protein D1J60_29320 [Streptomyces sp. W1SF4]